MKTFIFILILLAFLQTTIIPLDLVLIVLAIRALIISDKNNLYLAFGLGLLVSFLTNTPLGFYSIVYLVLVQMVMLLNKTSLSRHFLVVIPVIFFVLVLETLSFTFIFKQSFVFWPEVIGSILALPLYILLSFWEDRFVIKNTQIKLKI